MKWISTPLGLTRDMVGKNGSKVKTVKIEVPVIRQKT